MLFDDGSFCNDLRSADIVVSTITAMCDIYKFILSGQSRVRHKERDLVQKRRLYFFSCSVWFPEHSMLLNKSLTPWNSGLFTNRLLASLEETTVLALSDCLQITQKRSPSLGIT